MFSISFRKFHNDKKKTTWLYWSSKCIYYLCPHHH